MKANQQFPESEQDNHSAKKRDWTRLPPDSSVTWLVVHDEPKLATISDESYGGIGLIMDEADIADIRPGDEVTVLHYGHPTPGSVQWIKTDPEAQLVRLGIQWVGR